jgi:hypothetical protein
MPITAFDFKLSDLSKMAIQRRSAGGETMK